MPIELKSKVSQRDALRALYRISDISHASLPLLLTVLKSMGIEVRVTNIKGIVNTAHIQIDKVHYYGESKSPVSALRKAIVNAVEDYEDHEGRCVSGY